jgi:hypothetical protein
MSSSDTSPSTSSSPPPQPAAAAPAVDNRDFDKIFEEFMGLVQYYLPGEWDVSAENNLGGAGIALAKIFAEILENVIVRLNKLPERNFIEFLNEMGVNLISAIPATTPVTIALSPNVSQDVLIPAATKLATDATSAHDSLTFETEDEMLVTTAKISEIYSTDNTIDAIYSHTEDFAATKSFFLFGGSTTGAGKNTNLQEHSLYLGHAALLNIKSSAIIITLLISTENTNGLDKLTKILNGVDSNGKKIVTWEYNWQVDEAGNQTASTLSVLPSPAIVKDGSTIAISLKKDDENEIKTLQVNGIESRWIRCRIVSLDDPQLLANSPSVNNIEIQVGNIEQTHPGLGLGSSSTGIAPDALAYNEVPLNINNISSSAPFYPFGIKPAALDSFYIASRDAFSKLGATLVLSFSFIPSPSVDNKTIQINAPPNTPVQITLTGAGDVLTFSVVGGPMYGSISPTPLVSNIVTYTPHVSAALTDSFTYQATDSQGAVSNTATVRIGINQKPTPPPVPTPTFTSATAVLSWEYWNGNGWAGLDTVTTDSNGNVSFSCPLDISHVQVSGIEDYWIRIRIASGDYGKIEMTSSTTGGVTTWSEDDSNIQEPQLSSLPNIEITQVPTALQQCLTYNNLEYTSAIDTDGNISTAFQPFIGMEDVHPTVYLGFDKEVDGGPVQLFVSLNEREFPKGVSQPIFDFNYYSKVVGQDLNYEEKKLAATSDGTSNLTKSGNIKLFFPADIASSSNFGTDLFWIKLIDSTNTYAQNMQPKKTSGTTIQPPEIKAISLNTVSVIQATTVSDEIVGSSTGLLNQTFTLTNIPICLSEFQLWVNEGIYLSDEEMTALLQEQRLKKVTDQTGNLIEAWVLWNRVDDMYASGPNDRNFTLNTALGIIQFGDDIKGMIPAVGDQNIKATYVAADQATGTAAAGEINSLKSNIPFVDSVTNPGPAQGAVPAETTENVLLRGPQLLKNRGQAVTTEDFEWLAREQYPILARVKCMPATNTKGLFQPGHVSIVIVQTSNEAKPMPSLGLLSDVQRNLVSSSSNVISSTAQLKVISPVYIMVSVTADIYPVSMDLASAAQDTATDQLTTFLHPLLGGFDGNGWDFGYLVSPADIYRKLATIPEIDHANNVSIDFQDDTGSSVMGYNSTTALVLPQLLMYSGIHKLSVKSLGK